MIRIDLWNAAYPFIDDARAEAIYAAAHRLLRQEGGDETVVLAAAALATVSAQHKAHLIEEYVPKDKRDEVMYIAEADNHNAALVHDAVLLAQFHKNVWGGDLATLEHLLPNFKTSSGEADAQRSIAERRVEQKAQRTGELPEGATPVVRGTL